MKDNANESAIIVDIGTARTKITVAKQNGESIEFETSTIDESLAGAWQESGQAGLVRSISAIGEKVASVAQITPGARVYVLGAHLFRDESYSPELLRIANAALGFVNVLSAEREAALFFRSVSGEGQAGEALVALDVGGGSVQLVWGVEDSDFLSAPLGTYSIQERFQKSLDRSIAPESDAWRLAYEAVHEALKPVLELRGLASSRLVVGSNIMADFFAAAFREAGLEGLADDSYSRQNIAELCRLIGGQPYEELGRFFATSPGFMYGADKLLVVVSAAMDLLESAEVSGTNLSVSKGAALLALRSPGDLDALGFKCS